MHMHTDVDTCDCTGEAVQTPSALKVDSGRKNPLLHWGIKSTSALYLTSVPHCFNWAIPSYCHHQVYSQTLLILSVNRMPDDFSNPFTVHVSMCCEYRHFVLHVLNWRYITLQVRVQKAQIRIGLFKFNTLFSSDKQCVTCIVSVIVTYVYCIMGKICCN